MPAERQRGSQRHPRRRGVTIVEVALACAILTIVAVATGSYLHLARGQAALQRNRRTALGVANSRLEALRSAIYTSVQPPFNNYNLYYVDFMTGAWRVSDTDRGETVALSGLARPLTTTVRFMDASGGNTAYNCLRFGVTLQYGAGAGQVVRLETLRAQ